MKIDRIQYGRVVNLGNYENAKLGAWSAVEEGDEPEEVMRMLMHWIDTQADARHEQETAREEAERNLAKLTSENYDLERRVKEARETWVKAREFLKAVGLEVPRSYLPGDDNDEMPF